MKKFTLIIAAVAVGFLPEVAFCYETHNTKGVDALIPAAKAAFYLKAKETNPYMPVEAIHEPVRAAGEEETADRATFVCDIALRKANAAAQKILHPRQQAGVAGPTDAAN